MADDIWNAPKAAAPFKYSVLLDNISSKWPKRVARMFERRSFEYSGGPRWGALSYVTWKRRQIRAIGGI